MKKFLFLIGSAALFLRGVLRSIWEKSVATGKPKNKMNPLIPLFIGLAETLLQDEPEIVAQVNAILSKRDPTPADWLSLHQQVLAKTYGDYVPASALPAATPAIVLPPVETAAVQSSAPISQPGAINSTVAAADQVKTTSTPAPAVTTLTPYLADGSPNPNFVHQA